MTADRAVRAVVVTWNGAHLLPPCLDSLLQQTVADDLHVVVVDNASTDGTGDLLQSRYPSVEVRRSPVNEGFAGGVVRGCAGFDGEAILLLNNDAVLHPDALELMLAELRGDDAVGAVTARIMLEGWFRAAGPRPAGPLTAGGVTYVPCGPEDPGALRLVNSTGNQLTPSGAGVDRDWLAVDGEEQGGADAPGFSGGAALLRRTALEACGGFDADLFLYYEDTDVSLKMRAQGWTIRYRHDAVADHRHAASSDATSALFRYYNTRNSLVVAGRHASGPVVLRSALRQAAGLLRAVVRRSEPGPVLAARARGLWHAVRRAPVTWRERRVWRSAARRHKDSSGR